MERRLRGETPESIHYERWTPSEVSRLGRYHNLIHQFRDRRQTPLQRGRILPGERCQ